MLLLFWAETAKLNYVAITARQDFIIHVNANVSKQKAIYLHYTKGNVAIVATPLYLPYVQAHS